MEQISLLQSQFHVKLSWQDACSPVRGVHSHASRVCMSSAMSTSMLRVLEDVEASSHVRGIHMAWEFTENVSAPSWSSYEDTDLQRFFLLCDDEPFQDGAAPDDDDQAIRDFFEDFQSTEDASVHYFRNPWDNDNQNFAVSIGGALDEVEQNLSLPLCEPIPLHEELQESFFDTEDDISIVKLISTLKNIPGSTTYQVLIPKQLMISMPSSPNDLILPPEVASNFCINVQLSDLKNPQHVDACIDWLLEDDRDGIAFSCKHGVGGSLGLIQLSAHQRCVLINVHPGTSGSPVNFTKLSALMSNSDILKVGLNIQKDALALYHYMGIITNNCIRISQFVGTKRRKSLLEMCRDLFHWDWNAKKELSVSNWASKELSLEQVRYAALDAWTTRLVWVGQEEFWHVRPPSFSLGDLPWMLLDYFGRSVFSLEVQNRKEEDTSVEVKGATLELYQGYLSLKQKHFRCRVMGQKSVVELHYKDKRKPQRYITLYREGNRVILDNAEPSTVVKDVGSLKEEISMISKVLVDNTDSFDIQKQKLEESLYVLLCIPGACPRHILVALGCLGNQNLFIPSRGFCLHEASVQNCSLGLNPSQLEAWLDMLSSPLSAVIGPPGTGKTTVIAAVARAWLQLASPGETLLCTAHQNVAVRHLAETMVRIRMPGVLLLVSEDFYVGWHEEEYNQDVRAALVVSGSYTNASIQSWRVQNGNAPPRILLCTLSLIGTESFHASLAGNKVSSMIIDECSQAAEGSLIPVLGSLPHLEMLSVVGDPCQLPPYGIGPKLSVFDLLAQSCDVKHLEEQYRMPYSIAEFVSTEFYGGKLKTDPNKRKKDSDGALLWVNIKGTIDSTTGTSLSNQKEAEAVVDWCRTWKSTCKETIKRGKVIVLTLYEAQRSLISGFLAEEGMGEEVIVYNADSFQGQEADIVLISLVVGARVSGFASDRRRACVLLSRARQQLVLFGNLNAIKRQKGLSGNEKNIWMALAKYCQSNGWVISKAHAKSMVQKLYRTYAGYT
ncbi:hypothetical protein KP509_04G052000 [Ceratopteris richardii]|uniref:Uncharacterized protein n=1 Tax=Ceratopteris richardii TaxID=49495 RepID=A0A8T2USX7_CERRI|nr:hypothetical protein KP509_04G052000 [Ceratopteris richardii]